MPGCIDKKNQCTGKKGDGAAQALAGTGAKTSNNTPPKQQQHAKTCDSSRWRL